jgi:hypothetical protein
MLFVNDLELAHTLALDLTLDPGEPGVQLFEEGPLSYPVQHNHDVVIRKSRFQLQEMRHEGGV